jgi:RND superfamily putative drug exporter
VISVSRRFASWLFRHHRTIVVVWLLGLVACLSLLLLHPVNSLDTELTGAHGTEAEEVSTILRDRFGIKLGNNADLVVTGKVDGPDLLRALQARVPEVKRTREIEALTPHALRLFHIEIDSALLAPVAEALTPKLRAFSAEYGKSHGVAIEVTGGTAFQFDTTDGSQRDTQRSESVSLLVSLVVLVCTLGAPAAAILPLLVGISTIVSFQASANLFGLPMNAVSNVLTTLVGMALAMDYAIFLVSRFREELRNGATVEDALGTMLEFTGRTVVYSGAVMAVSLAALLFPDVSFCRAVVANLMRVVGLSVFFSVTVLPALLAWKPDWLDKPRALTARIARLRSERIWYAVARQVAARPLLAFIIGVGAISILAWPLIGIKLWEPVQAIAPLDSESRQAYKRLQADGWGGELMPFQLVVKAPVGTSVYDPATLSYIYDLTRALQAEPRVASVASITSWKPKATKEAYIKFYNALSQMGLRQGSARLKQAVPPEADLTLINVYPRDLMRLDDTDSILSLTQAYVHAHPQRQVLIGGVVARVRDFTVELYRHWWALLSWVVVGTYLLLLGYMRSVVLPLKAAVMNFLPILGANGVLVAVFQYGLGASVLHTPINGAVTNMVPVMLFCIVFGLSMDYEVLMLGRITEAYGRLGDVREAVIEGMGSSGSVITGAALILLGVFATGVTSSSPQTQEICTGITAALAIEATIVRFLLVPSFMILLGRWNWWRPFGPRQASGPATLPAGRDVP